MPRTLKELRERQAAIRSQLAEIQGLPEPEGDDEAARAEVLQDRSDLVDELLAEHDQIEEEIRPLAARQERLDAIRSSLGNGTARTEPGTSPTAPSFRTDRDAFENLDAVRAGVVPADDMRSRALKAIEKAPRHVDDRAREHMTRLVQEGGRQAALIARHMLLTGSEEYHRQFEEFVASAGTYVGPALRDAMALSPDSAGGALVPFTLDPTIILTNAGVVDPIRQLATHKQIATDSWNGVTSAGVTAQFLAENTAADDASPTFTQKPIPVHKAFAFVQGSYEILADSNFADQLGRLLADSKARLEGDKFATGTGSGMPTGIVVAGISATTSRVAAGTAGAFAAADVFNVANAVPPRYAGNASWLANKSVFNAIRQFSTVTSGGAFWTDLGMGQPSKLLGSGAYEVSSMAAYSTATTTNLLLAGDVSQYYVVDRVGLTMIYNNMIMDTTTGNPLGAGGWVAYWRVGGDLTDPAAVRVIRPFTTTSGWV